MEDQQKCHQGVGDPSLLGPYPECMQPCASISSVKFERLMQFAKAEPKPDAPSSPIQLDLFKY
ncbi:hypothetical protein TTHERM_000193169 (macronuclear) [Tetrahymena thermophila SB210]|uniref:Uncharacterized protein n=1 Tax=Tetrahymena thermophila (strain SB210) TaxID=312017 RepID=W7XHV7_TETTS|nr:hypothetical protein TTHERM_000193169 [Tetrahymena thermophila SB210]EWS74091.1 hypothetical protein TTHERM_000193169 [Tetrahymena thermophila SB210]|eukprot:XP_012653346.1 hypothetical protein TTHERM_000193169 [Tetrahymena thermophila SB210]